MPVFTYKCRDCDYYFDSYESEKDMECLQCKGTSIEKLTNEIVDLVFKYLGLDK